MSSISKYFACSNTSFSQITLSSPFNLCNPSYYESERDTFEEYIQPFFKYISFEVHSHSCRIKPAIVFLPLTSKRYNKLISVQVPHNNIDTYFIDIIDIYLAYGNKPNKSLNIYDKFIVFMTGLELSKQRLKPIISYRADFMEFIFSRKEKYRTQDEIRHLEEGLRDQFIFDSSIFNQPSVFNKSFVCACYKQTLESTGLCEAIGGTAYGCYHSLKFGLSDDTTNQFKKDAVDVAIDFTNLYVNFNVKTILITILRIINKFIPLTKFVQHYFTTVKHLITTLTELIPTGTTPQASNTVGDTLTTTFNIQTIFQGVDLTDVTSYLEAQGTNILTIVSVFAAAAVTIGSFYLCRDFKFNKESRLYTVNLANSLYNIHKFKTGISATIDMFKNLMVYIEDTIKSLLCINDDDLFVRNLALVEAPMVEGLSKFNFIEYATELLDPSNKDLLLVNQKLSEKLDFCCCIIDKLYYHVAIKSEHVKNSLLNLITKYRFDLFALRSYRIRSKSDEFFREVPYCISLIGKPGSGKSVFMPKLAECIMLSFEKLGIALPPKDSWMYSVNFTDKFMTKYSQQYCVMVDDAFQDSSPLGDRSSALDLISWVSCIPHYTNQAGLSEKGIAFKSKLVLVTTNIEQPERKEIMEKDALYRRFHKSIIFEKCKCCTTSRGVKTMTPCSYPFIQKGYHIVKYTVLTGARGATPISSEDFILECVKDIMAWQKHQNDLFQNQRPTEEFINSIVSKCTEQEPPTTNNQVETLTTTGFWQTLKCKTGTTTYQYIDKCFYVRSQDLKVPTKVQQYDCECVWHTSLNIHYLNYVETRTFLGAEELPIDIELFRQHRLEREFQISAIKDKLKTCMQRFLDIISSKKFQLLGAGIGMAVMAIGAFALMPKKAEPLENTKASYITKVKRPITKKATLSTTGGEEFSEASTLLDHLRSKRVVCQLTTILEDEGIQRRLTSVCVRIKGKFVLFNDHIRRELIDGQEFEIHIPNRGNAPSVVRQIFNSDNYEQIGGLDAGIYQCDAKMQLATDMIHHFSDDEVEMNPKKVFMQSWVKGVPETMSSLVATPVTKAWTITTDDGEKVYDLLTSYSINTTTLKGMSGSLLVCSENRTKNKFLGIQCARGSKPDYVGYCVPLSRKMINDTLDKFQNELSLSIDHEKTLETVCSIEYLQPSKFVGKELLYVGDISNKNKIVRQAIKSSLVPSVIQDTETLTQEPSVLCNTDDRLSEQEYGKSIIYKAMKGYDETIGAIDSHTLNEAVNSLSEEYAYKMRDVNYEPRLLNDFEMVNGIPGFVKRLNLKTSPGYPYVVEKKTGFGGKYEWFDEIEGDLPSRYGKAYQMKADLRGWLEQLEHDIRQGIITPIVAYACLKDETRPLAKIETGTTRAFLCLPLPYNLLIRKYFGLFVGNQHLKAGEISSCVGIDPAKQWIKIANKLFAKSDKWEDFDYKNWDQHLHPELVMRVAQVVNRWYGDDDDSPDGLARRALLYHLCHTYVIVNGKLFQKGVGQCSGCAITAELNCLIHDILMFYTWITLHENEGLTTCLDDYRDYVANVLYGDDIVQAVDPRYTNIQFTGEKIAPVMEKLGMKITPGDKISTSFVKKDPKDILFLKRSFLFDDYKWKAPLRSDILENIPQWIHRSDNNEEATKVNCEMALQESFMHGENYFNEIRDNLNKRIFKYNIENAANMQVLTKTYSYYKRMYNNEEYICLGLPNDATLSTGFIEE